jgi:hypothetical protein
LSLLLCSSTCSVAFLPYLTDADDAGGLLRVEVVPKNLTAFNTILSTRDVQQNSTALRSVPEHLANLSFHDINATYALVVTRDLWTLKQFSLTFTAVAFDFESLLIDTVPRQVRLCVCVCVIVCVCDVVCGYV